jgi:hypothetical protein
MRGVMTPSSPPTCSVLGRRRLIRTSSKGRSERKVRQFHKDRGEIDICKKDDDPGMYVGGGGLLRNEEVSIWRYVASRSTFCMQNIVFDDMR